MIELIIYIFFLLLLLLFLKATEQLIHQVNRVNELKSIEKRYHELQAEKLVLQLKKTTIVA